MAFRFGTASRVILTQCDPAIVEVCELALRGYYRTVTSVDFAVREGVRDRETQDALYAQGLTRVKWPGSAHNKTPSQAFHAIPWHARAPHVRWGDHRAFEVMATHILGAASVLQVPMLWGGHWKTLRDYAHFELLFGAP